MIRLTIDGQSVEVPAGTTVLEACRTANIHIPTLCDHPSLKPYGGCRLCVVEIEGARTLQASCTLPAWDGMVVHTDTPKLRKARDFVLTLIFSERNHFCMYCQKSNGDCELQNAAYGEGMTHWPIQPNWKPYLVDASHPHYVFDHNRCILCRRCVRACSDLVGNFTLALEERGANTMVVADYGLPLGESSCIKCGTCVQICPTGSLIDRNSAYLGLDKETEKVASTCVGCSVGCGTELVVRDNQLLRVDGRWDAPVNGGVLCELGRYLSLEDDRPRLTTPLVRKNGVLEPVAWEEAIEAVANRFAPLAGQNGQGVAALVSTRLPAEAIFAFKELFSTGLRSGMISTIEQNLTTALPTAASFDDDLDALKTADCVVAIGVDLNKSHQVAGFFVKRNLESTRIVIDCGENEMENIATYALRIPAGSDATLMKGLMAGITRLGLNKTDASPDLENLDLAAVSQATGIATEMIVAVGREIASAKQPVIVFGKGLTQAMTAETLAALQALAQMTGAAVIHIKGKANSLAAHRYGLDVAFAPQGHQAVYLALADDFATPRLLESLQQVPFLVVQASHASAVTERADVVLPVEMWAEQEGHYVNLEGRVQMAHKALVAPAGVRTNLEVLQDLARCLDAEISDRWEAQLSVA